MHAEASLLTSSCDPPREEQAMASFFPGPAPAGLLAATTAPHPRLFTLVRSYPMEQGPGLYLTPFTPKAT